MNEHKKFLSSKSFTAFVSYQNQPELILLAMNRLSSKMHRRQNIRALKDIGAKT